MLTPIVLALQIAKWTLVVAAFVIGVMIIAASFFAWEISTSQRMRLSALADQRPRR
ncbi:MAG: hypothetical protein QGM50_04315 [Anaerolineae bacterium]|nr:hypothetical protein [Anaerolineae bacterium]